MTVGCLFNRLRVAPISYRSQSVREGDGTVGRVDYRQESDKEPGGHQLVTRMPSEATGKLSNSAE